jgi:hypothetical protein
MTELPNKVDEILKGAEERAEKAADDWLADFAKKSNEALAKRAAEKQVQPPPDEKALVAALARKDHTEYDKMRSEVADVLGIRVGTLDDKVEAAKIEREADKLLMPHWDVVPAAEAVDAAVMLAEIEARILRHVAMPRHLAFVCALWIAQTWIHEHATYSPILFITAPERDSGKSTLLNVIKFMVRRELSSVGISAAALIARSRSGCRPSALTRRIRCSCRTSISSRL